MHLHLHSLITLNLSLLNLSRSQGSINVRTNAGIRKLKLKPWRFNRPTQSRVQTWPDLSVAGVSPRAPRNNIFDSYPTRQSSSSWFKRWFTISTVRRSRTVAPSWAVQSKGLINKTITIQIFSKCWQIYLWQPRPLIFSFSSASRLAPVVPWSCYFSLSLISFWRHDRLWGSE